MIPEKIFILFIHTLIPGILNDLNNTTNFTIFSIKNSRPAFYFFYFLLAIFRYLFKVIQLFCQKSERAQIFSHNRLRDFRHPRIIGRRQFRFQRHIRRRPFLFLFKSASANRHLKGRSRSANLTLLCRGNRHSEWKAFRRHDFYLLF